MNHQYFLGPLVLGGKKLEISPETYNEYLKAVQTINALHSLEELFSIVALSGIEIERFLLNLTLDDLVADDDFSHKWLDHRQQINLLILSFMTSVRAYHDQRPQVLGDALNLAELEQHIRAIFSTMYDASLEYRVMEALRNYAQHARLPLGTISYDRSWESESARLKDGEPARMRRLIAINIDLQDVLKLKKVLKKSIVPELEAIKPPKIDARYFIRTYLSQLAACHMDVRAACSQAGERAILIVRGLPEIFKASFAEEPDLSDHLSLFTSKGSGVQPIYIGSDLCDRLDYVSGKWKSLKHFDRMYITSQLVAKSDWSVGNNSKTWIPK